MKIESVLRLINKRITEYEQYFGKYSYEYGYAKNLLFVATKGSGEALLRKFKGVITLKRGKAALAEITENPVLEENLFDLWEALKGFGTVNSIKAQYIDLDTQDPYMEQAFIQESSAALAREVFNDDDYYEKMQEEVNEVEDDEGMAILKDMAKKFKEKAPGVQKDIKWDEIKDLWDKYQNREEDEMREKAGVN
jgi:hypothetical protein